MIYLWDFRDDYSQMLVGAYDRERGPDRFLFKKGERLEANSVGKPRFQFTAKAKALCRLNDLGNTAMIPLVSDAVAKILRQVCPGEVQLFPAEVSCIDCNFEDYSIVNVLNRVRGLDLEKSVYTFILDTTGIGRIDTAVYRNDCLGSLHLAREDKYSSHLLVSERLREDLRQFSDLGFRPVDCVD